ncbi:TolC family protein [Flavobacterium antarcticum]|uniref:TolC family protein n=1 Tax=Flavobacterium antarcticum TaxID=271155 RepID=UPI0003B4BA18|nr:TolC family protein [Flavobacterium antarcticum]
MKQYTTLFILLISIFAQAQEKKWTLKECVDYAIEKNISIQQSKLDIESIAIERKDAIGNFLPTANASASHSWNIGLNINPITNLAETQTFQNTSMGVNVGVDIYKGMQNQNRLRRANLTKIAGQYQLTKMKDDVSLNVANAYLQILFNKENVKVQKEQLANNNKQKNRTKELVDAGSVARGDLLDMTATVATSEQAVVNAENALLISKLSLAQLLQLDDFKNFDVAENDYSIAQSEVMLQSPDAIYNKAKEERVELKIARANLEVAQKDIEIAKGALQPSLSGFYSFSSRATNSDRYTSDGNGNIVVKGPDAIFNQFSDNKGNAFGLQLNIPILNGFSVRNNIEHSKIAFKRSQIAVSQQELDLERNVYTAFTDVNGALNAYDAAVTALEARTESFNYAQEKFNVGLMNAFDLNQAQLLFANAESEVIRTKYDYIFRVKVVEFYFGIPITGR